MTRHRLLTYTCGALVALTLAITGCSAHDTQEERMTYSAPPPMTIDQDAHYTATIVTEKGDLVV